jgi:two-component system, OmpR family, sensor histidine kinase CiaH
MNNVFNSAIARLTILYVAVLAVVCTIFSGFIYTLATNEIDQSSRRQVVGFRGALGRFVIDEKESELLRKSESDFARARLRTRLLLGNIVMLTLGAVLSYHFAKRTLLPLEQSARAQERFTSDASHELRTPLAAMRTEIEVVLRSSTTTTQELRATLQSSLEEVTTLQTMTENLLSLARLKELGDKKRTTTKKLFSPLARKYRILAKTRRMHFRAELQDIEITVNEPAILQLCTLLLNNALKYAGPSTTVWLRISSVEGELQLVVEDNGIGIPDEAKEKVFERFYKADNSRTDSRKSGHGLGLSIAKQLTEAMAGTISLATPTNNKGVAFIVHIPLS